MVSVPVLFVVLALVFAVISMTPVGRFPWLAAAVVFLCIAMLWGVGILR